MRFYRDYRKKADGTFPEYKAYACDRYANGGRNACSSHYINQKALVSVVLTDIRNKAFFARQNRENLKERILARKESANAERVNTLKAELAALDKHLVELEKLIQAAYEDKVMGRIPESVCIQFLNEYETEQTEKQEHKKDISVKLAQSRANEQSVDD